jgi:hypothetical protein
MSDTCNLVLLSTRAKHEKTPPTTRPLESPAGSRMSAAEGRWEFMASVHAASRAAAAIPPSQRTADDWKVINLGDKETRNADFKAREHERVYGRK